jgi:methylated-DNA-protein-cysteine methyltransferase related protein
MANGQIKDKIYKIVKQIPEGKVAYYGQIGQMVGVPAQVVGWILSGMKEEEYKLIPWERVVAKTGEIPTVKLGFKGELQIQLLIEQGFDLSNGQIDMAQHLWQPEQSIELT